MQSVGFLWSFVLSFLDSEREIGRPLGYLSSYFIVPVC